MNDQITSWITDIQDLARIANTEPQLAYAAFVYGTSKKWQYVMRTTPHINHLFGSLDHAIQEVFIPTIIGKHFIDDDMRTILSLPARYGGMNIGVNSEVAHKEYENSKMVTSQLTKAILNQDSILNFNRGEVNELKRRIQTDKDQLFKDKRLQLMDHLPA